MMYNKLITPAEIIFGILAERYLKYGKQEDLEAILKITKDLPPKIHISKDLAQRLKVKTL